MPRPRPIEENPLNRIAERPHLAGEATRTTWSFVWPCLAAPVAAAQAAELAEFFAAEVVRLEADQ
jgi:hypothetical protein